MPRRHRSLARICPDAEETAVHRRSPAKSGYCRTELPLHQKGAGRSPEGINAAGSWIRTNFGEHGQSRYLSCTTEDPPKCSVFLNWYCFDPLSQLTLTAHLRAKSRLRRLRSETRLRTQPFYVRGAWARCGSGPGDASLHILYPAPYISYLDISTIGWCTYAVSQEKRA